MWPDVSKVHTQIYTPMPVHFLIRFVACTVEAWMAEAALLRRRGQVAAAVLVESLAVELQERAERWLAEELTLSEAAENSGLSYSTLQHLVRAGELRDAGRRGRPRVSRGDLPHRRRRMVGVHDADEDVGEDLIEDALLDLEG